jgi:hypothetical protein
MCNLLNYQTRDLEENLQKGKKQLKTADVETVEIIVPAQIPLSCK